MKCTTHIDGNERYLKIVGNEIGVLTIPIFGDKDLADPIMPEIMLNDTLFIYQTGTFDAPDKCTLENTDDISAILEKITLKMLKT